MIDSYFDHIRAVIAASPIVRSVDLQTDRRSDEIGFLRGDLAFGDNSRLHLREYVHQPEGLPPERYAYSYHYQRADNSFIFRYDDTGHYLDLPNAPHHKHAGDEANVVSSTAPDLAEVLSEIERLVPIE